MVGVHRSVSLAASTAWPDKKWEPNRQQTTDDRRQTTDDTQEGVFLDIDAVL